MKRLQKDTIKALEQLGFDHIWTNTQGYECYVHPGDPQQTELSVSPSLRENSARTLLRSAQKIAGVARPIEKRRGSQVKERAEAERERARDRLRLAREKLARAASAAEIAHHTAEVEAREKELRDLERMMTSIPGGGSAHRGTRQARHCTGGSR